jgi:hypothetical protein
VWAEPKLLRHGTIDKVPVAVHASVALVLFVAVKNKSPVKTTIQQYGLIHTVYVRYRRLWLNSSAPRLTAPTARLANASRRVWGVEISHEEQEISLPLYLGVGKGE